MFVLYLITGNLAGNPEPDMFILKLSAYVN